MPLFFALLGFHHLEQSQKRLDELLFGLKVEDSADSLLFDQARLSQKGEMPRQTGGIDVNPFLHLGKSEFSICKQIENLKAGRMSQHLED
jgi:hypothetical protein